MDWKLSPLVSRLRRLGRQTGVFIVLGLAPGATGAADQHQDLSAGEVSGSKVAATVADGRLTLHAEGAPLGEVLRAIGRASGLVVVLRRVLDDPIHQSFTSEPLEDAIRKLAGAHSLVMVGGDGTSDAPTADLAEIRVTGNRAQVASDAADVKIHAAAPDVAPDEPAVDPIDRQEAYRQAVLDYMPPTKADLLFDLNGPDGAARVAAVPKVGSLPPWDAIAVVSYVFANDDDPTVRGRAVAALSRLDGPGARGLLRERALGDDDPGLRMQALNALASSRGERAINVLTKALRQDPEPRVRMSAIRALGRVGGDWARRSLERAARDINSEISLAAENALATWPKN